ncbi:MAG: glutamate racemase [Ruminococcaceae bacterium]|nr:glutamate racemase [Oscillospiraceae bacterium]
MDRYIGVFDSGLGGLTNVKELHRLLPGENIVYFGDTGRVPYGSRSNDTIIKYTFQDIRFLKSFPLKAIIIACGTVSSIALDVVRKTEPDLPIIGVVEPSVKKAISLTKNGKIGVIGTEGTIRSGAYGDMVLKEAGNYRVFEKSCPLFVPLVENGYIESEATRIIVRDYLTPLKTSGIDTLILGCTHYPLLTDVIREVMGDEVSLISPGVETAAWAKSYLEEEGLLNTSGKVGETEYYVSDGADKFARLAENFLGSPIYEDVKKIDIESW